MGRVAFRGTPFANKGLGDRDLLAVDEPANRVFAVSYKTSAVHVLDARDGTVLHAVAGAIPTSDSVIGLTVDARRRRVVVIVDNDDGGSVRIQDARTGSARRAYVMGSDPVAVTVDGRTSHAIVAYAAAMAAYAHPNHGEPCRRGYSGCHCCHTRSHRRRPAA